MTGQDSFYSGFPETFTEMPESQPKPRDQVVEQFANREDLSQPYRHADTNKRESATIDTSPKNSAACEFWRFYTKQMTNCDIAREFNKAFSWPVQDYAAEKARYIAGFNLLK